MDTVLPGSPGRRRTSKKVSEGMSLLLISLAKSYCTYIRMYVHMHVCISGAAFRNLNLELKLIMDKIRTLGLVKKQDRMVRDIATYTIVRTYTYNIRTLVRIYVTFLCAGNVAVDSWKVWVHSMHGTGTYVYVVTKERYVHI